MQEEAYVEFLQLRRVPLQERKCADEATDVVPQVSITSYFSSSSILLIVKLVPNFFSSTTWNIRLILPYIFIVS